MTLRRPSVFGGAIAGSISTSFGLRNFVSSSRPSPSGIRIITMSTWTLSSRLTRSTHGPSTRASPSSVMPSAVKKGIAAARSSTTTLTWSSLLIVMSPILRPPNSFGSGEPVQSQEPDVVLRRPVLGQVRHDLPDHAAELVAVSGKPGGQHHLGSVRVQVQDEVLVRTVGEETGLEHQCGTVCVGEVALGKHPQQPLVLRIGLAIHPIGIDSLLAVVGAAALEARYQEAGKAVVAALLQLDVKDGKHIGCESLRAARLQPGEHLPFGHRQLSKLRHQLRCPRAGGDDQSP